jgi:hypothetical protein
MKEQGTKEAPDIKPRNWQIRRVLEGVLALAQGQCHTAAPHAQSSIAAKDDLRHAIRNALEHFHNGVAEPCRSLPNAHTASKSTSFACFRAQLQKFSPVNSWAVQPAQMIRHQAPQRRTR